MKPITFHPEVKNDIEAAYLWYESHALGLGDEFIAELEAAYHLIQQRPYAWPTFGAVLHRYILKRFPFSILYNVNEKIIIVTAVMHHSRRPGYWAGRI